MTLKYKGDGVFLRSIISAQTGNCPEDCSFCSQSAHFDTEVEAHPLMAAERILGAARQAEKMGAMDFCIVISAKGPTPRIFKKVLEAVDLLCAETNLKVGCSLGDLTEGAGLRAQGPRGVEIQSQHRDLQEPFSQHMHHSQLRRQAEDRFSGKGNRHEPLLGRHTRHGRDHTSREWSSPFEIRDLNPTWVPINFLDPRPGTPFENLETIQPLEAVRTISIYRLVLPDKIIMTAGGREVTLRDLQAMGLVAGANAMILGNYLTTPGRSPQEDLRMLDDLQMPVRKEILN